MRNGDAQQAFELFSPVHLASLPSRFQFLAASTKSV
jgi:hypothetical protein